MNKVILNEQKIIDNITEGYPVTVTREDGFRYIISMERKRGEEVYSYQFGRIKREFDSFDSLENALVHMSLQRLFFNYKKKMSEIKFRYKFDSNAYVVDEAYLLKIERMARMNGEKMEKLAEKKFRDYL